VTPVIAALPARVLHADLDPKAAWIDQLFEPPSDARWLLLAPGAQHGEEQDFEARLAIGNGAFGMRASLEETPHDLTQLGQLLARISVDATLDTPGVLDQIPAPVVAIVR
jgi:hypothetical protein